MTTYRCEIVYQGYQCVAGSYRRGDGMQAEPGWVTIPLEDMGKMIIHPRSIPWRSVAGVEYDGGMDMRTWKNARSRMTVTMGERVPSPEPKIGLNLSGDLVIRTYNDFTGALVWEMRYYDVYVDVGMEESTRGLASILEHKEGLVRVPLTDIRQYYAQSGPLFCRINCRRKNGTWDKDTLQADGETPWQLGEVVEFLFSQLPGSPPITDVCDLRTGAWGAPQGIEGRGEPAVQHIDELLARHGLKPQMQRDGKFSINRISSNRIAEQTIATEPGKSEAVKPGEIQYERLTSTPTKRASAVTFVGPRRVQRRTFQCTAVLQDPTTGKWHTLEKICKLWGYSLEKLNRMVFVSGPRQYADVPPSPTAVGAGDYTAAGLHNIRREALKMAYRQYIPWFMVNDEGDVIDPEKELIPFLPVMPETAWYKKELNAEQLRDYPKDKASRGDLDEIVMFPPVVRANLVGEKFFNSFKELEGEINGIINGHLNTIEALRSLSEAARLVGQDALKDLLQSEKVSEETIKDHTKYGVLENGVVLKIGGDTTAASKELGTVMENNLRLAYSKESEAAKQAVILYADRQKGAERSIDEQALAVQEVQKLLANAKAAFEKNGRIHGRYNKGQGPTLAAKVADMESCLIQADVPLCMIDRPWFFNGDDVRVIADGAVTVTYGYEIKGSGAYAFTNYLFFADDGGDPKASAVPTFAGCHRSSPIKAEVVKMESREYLAEDGNPMNFTACWTEARGKAAEKCGGPAVIPGWTMELHGLRKCVLDAGIMSVQHEWDGDVGITHVAVNAPGARMPLMAPNVRPPRQTGAVEIRETMQREGS